MRSPVTLKDLAVAAGLAAGLSLAATGWAGEGTVLAVRSEGVVVDAAALGDIQPRTKIEFVRPAGVRRSGTAGAAFRAWLR